MESFRSYTGAATFDELRELLKPLPAGAGEPIDLKACIGVLPKPLRWPVESMLKNRVRELAELEILDGVSDEIVELTPKLTAEEEQALLEQALEDGNKVQVKPGVRESLDEKFAKNQAGA